MVAAGEAIALHLAARRPEEGSAGPL
jgi:hypothetical protein